MNKQMKGTVTNKSRYLKNVGVEWMALQKTNRSYKVAQGDEIVISALNINMKVAVLLVLFFAAAANVSTCIFFF